MLPSSRGCAVGEKTSLKRRCRGPVVLLQEGGSVPRSRFCKAIGSKRCRGTMVLLQEEGARTDNRNSKQDI